MKKIGIIGGLGPESTIDYYSSIINAFKSGYEQNGFPEIFIHSVDLRSFLSQAEQGEWNRVSSKLTESVNKLDSCGAEFAAIASNTPHKVYDEIEKKTNIPLISIVKSALNHAKYLGVNKLCLLGTRFTMSSDFYAKEFDKEGILLFTPTLVEQDAIQNIIFSELEFGIVKDESKEKLLSIIERIKKEHNTQGVLLACTEFPLILKPGDFDQEYLDTVQIHIKAIVDYCKG